LPTGSPGGLGESHVAPTRNAYAFVRVEKSSPAAELTLLWQLAVAQLGAMIAACRYDHVAGRSSGVSHPERSAAQIR